VTSRLVDSVGASQPVSPLARRTMSARPAMREGRESVGKAVSLRKQDQKVVPTANLKAVAGWKKSRLGFQA
jgi:hypothetical protein